MGQIEIIHNTDNNISSFQQEAHRQALYYFSHLGPLKLQYISSYSLKYIHAGSIYYKYKKIKATLIKEKILILQGSQKNQTYIGRNGEVGFSFFLKEKKINNLIYRHLIREELNLESNYLVSGNKTFEKKIINLCQDLFLKLNDINSAYSDIVTIYERLEKKFVQSFLNLHCKNFQKKVYHNPAFLETIRKISIAVNFIHSNYHQKINLEDIAGTACLSRYCFSGHFKDFFLITPNEYLINYRLDKAAELIKLKKRSIGDIAIDCGFGSPQYFNYIFRKKNGYTPSRLCA